MGNSATKSSVGSTPNNHREFTGFVESILYFNPREAVQFEVVVKGLDGLQEKVRLKWLGQRTISGINLGSKLHVQGSLVATNDSNLPTIFNPKYDLVPLEAKLLK